VHAILPLVELLALVFIRTRIFPPVPKHLLPL